ncbi:alpha-methylacyl-CoA racemase [Penicillium vulpinum]|nr:alpha-methylacyl-CoA racemase [Penicillium vulpinum]KAJ5950619.1 alpha-methylacyl-CoA racemase [Penicillium vulpinum]
MTSLLLKKKYGVEPRKVVINTDRAQLFIMSTFIQTIDPREDAAPVEPSDLLTLQAKVNKYFPNCEIHNMGSSSRFPGFPHDRPEIKTAEESWLPFIEKIAQFDSEEIETLANDKYRQAGTICWSPEDYEASEQGKANAHVGLYEIFHHPHEDKGPTWWNDSPETELAELGASVLRVTAPHIADFSALHSDLNWGKWNAHLDLRKEEDKETLHQLILESDIVIDGHRPGVMDKWGFGKDDVLKIAKERKRGIIYMRENCYGWNGPWWYRSGWQPISDANTGVAMGYGRAMGHEEAVVPVLPNSDYCTGVVGAAAAIHALLKRSQEGGSYSIDIALNYYNRWLVKFVGSYPEDVYMVWTMPRLLGMMVKAGTDGIFLLEHFEVRTSKAIGAQIKTVKPVIKYVNGPVELKFRVGTRGNGVDKPRWPEYLSTEIIE